MTFISIEKKELVQICVVVKDLERSAQRYRDILGFDVPREYQSIAPYEQVRMTYMGQPTEAKSQFVGFPLGAVTFELLQPLGDGSVWMDYLNKYGEGLQHMTFNVTRTAAAAADFADHGYNITQQGLFNNRSGMFSYLDTEPKLGITLEFLEWYNGEPPASLSTFPADKGLGTDRVTQIGLVVHDIQQAAAYYREALGLPEPRWVDTPGRDITEMTFKGEPSDARAKLAFFDLGQVQLELIEPDETPSVWRNYLNARGNSAHHVAFQVRDTDAAIAHFASHGIGVAQQGLYGDRSGVYTYMDSEAELGIIIELLESFPHPR